MSIEEIKKGLQDIIKIDSEIKNNKLNVVMVETSFMKDVLSTIIQIENCWKKSNDIHEITVKELKQQIEELNKKHSVINENNNSLSIDLDHIEAAKIKYIDDSNRIKTLQINYGG